MPKDTPTADEIEPNMHRLRTDGGRTTSNVPVLSKPELKDSFPDWRNQIRHTEHLPERSAATVSPAEVLTSRLASRLPHNLYSHQATALNRLTEGENVVVTTSTSSGKTLIYQLQMARNHLSDSNSTALCLYPTKALSNDQEKSLNDMFRGTLDLDIHVGTYDGDTDSDRKQRIRNEANVILTNPAGLNVYLPRHNRDSGWHRFYSNLDLVVIDEEGRR